MTWKSLYDQKNPACLKTNLTCCLTLFLGNFGVICIRLKMKKREWSKIYIQLQPPPPSSSRKGLKWKMEIQYFASSLYTAKLLRPACFWKFESSYQTDRVLGMKKVHRKNVWHFFFLSNYHVTHVYLTWAENLRMVDIEINAWSPLFLNLQIK